MFRHYTDGIRQTRFPASALSAAFSGALAVACLSCDGGVVPPGNGVRIDPQTLLVWRANGARSLARPTLDASSVYFLSTQDNHLVTAVNRQTGAVRWSVHLPGMGIPAFVGGFGLAVAQGTLVVGDAEVYGLEVATGVVKWTFSPSVGRRPGFGRLTSDGTTVFCGSASGHLFGVDGATGRERWATKIASDSNVAVHDPVVDNLVVYAGFLISPTPGSGARLTGGVAAVSSTTGELLWSVLLPRNVDPLKATGARSIVLTPTLVLAGSIDGIVYGLDRSTGEIRVTIPESTFQIPPTPAPFGDERAFSSAAGRVYVGSFTGTVTSLDAATLSKRWTSTANFGSAIDIVADERFVYVTHPGGQMAVMNASDGKVVWWIESFDLRQDGFEGLLFGPVLAGETLYVGGIRESYALRRR